MAEARGCSPLPATSTAARVNNMVRRGIAEATALAEGRAFLLFRGVRGVLGVPWMAQQLAAEQARGKHGPSGPCPQLGCNSVCPNYVSTLLENTDSKQSFRSLGGRPRRVETELKQS